MESEPNPLDVLSAVLDPVRLAVLGASVRGAVSIPMLAEELEVRPKEIARAVGDLRAVGLLSADGELNDDALVDVGRGLPKAHPDLGEPIEGPWTETEAAIIGRFFSGVRLIEIPTSHRKRRLVLEKIAQEFEPGERYAERDVNFRIQLIHADYAAIRRYMVEEGFMDRADGAYWRTGGRYELPDIDDSAPLRIQTSLEGVFLVEYTYDKLDELLDAAGAEEIHRYMSDQFPYPYTRDDGESWIEACVAQDSPTNFLVEVDGVLRGGVGAMAGSGEKAGVAEIGWWLNPAWWGRGITSAAANALVEYLFTERDFVRLWAPVMAPNAASARVAEKAGLVLEGTAPSAYVKYGVRYDELDFGITRERWETLRSS
ncbi:MAG: GNAT family N-acetyltransferase [Actinomycetota bacterium]